MSNFTSPIPTAKFGAFSRFLDAASGDVAYTGVGFKPKSVIIWFGLNGAGGGSMGLGESIANSGTILSEDAATRVVVTVSGRVADYEDVTAGTGQRGELKSLDSNGFTITWTKQGAGGHTEIFGKYLAIP